MLRLLHLLIGHNWKLDIYSPYAYDEEIWWYRYCECGAHEEVNLNDDIPEE